MANKQKGEIGIEAGGERYTLSFSINALCLLESEFEDTAAEVSAIFTGGKGRKRVTTLRTLFWAGLSDNHPELSKTDAGKIMTALGYVEAVVKVGEAMTLAFPEFNAGPLAQPAAAPAVGGTGASC